MKEYTFQYGIEPDPSKFIRIGSNRDPKTQHSQKIAESIKQKMNLLGANPIIVANGFIIDGQHRHQACEYLGIPVPYIEIFGMTDEEMITAMHTLNSNAKNWGLADYLKLYCKKGYQNYLDLDSFMRDYDLSISIAIYMMRGFNDLAYKNASEESGFKDGDFKPIDEDRAKDKALFYKNIRNAVIAGHKQYLKFVKSTGFIKAFLKIATQQEEAFSINHMQTAFESDLKSKNPQFRKFESVEEYYDVLVKIYNSRNPKQYLLPYLELNTKRLEVEESEE
jgi:hypothetical protein